MTNFLNNPSVVLHETVRNESETVLHRSLINVAKTLLCEQYPSTWASVTVDDVTITLLTGGITNILYLLKEQITGHQVIVRLFGAGTEEFISRENENLVFATLSQRGLGPTFYGLFLNGRMEGFILNSRPLEPDDMCKAEISPHIADAIGHLHSQDIHELPRSSSNRTNIWLWGKIKQFFDLSADMKYTTDQQDFMTTQMNITSMCVELQVIHDYIEQQYENLHQQENTTDFMKGCSYALQEVLCHNDLLSGNLLLVNESSSEARIQIIDYEYAAYNYRGFDIANHFCECCGFECDYDNNFPTSANIEVFLHRYLHSLNVDVKSSDFVAGFREAICWFVLASHLFWGSWALVQAANSSIDFDYLGYAKLRFDGYFKHKSMFTSLTS